METLEGGAKRAPARPALAYTAGEADGGGAKRDGLAVRQDSADGDVVEATFTTDILTLRRQLEEQEAEAEQARRDALELRNELSAARAESAALKANQNAAKVVSVPPASPPPTAEDSETSMRLVSDAFAELAKVRTESFKARKEFEKERNDHRIEMVRTRAQYHAAQDELQRLIKVRRTTVPPVPPPKASVALAPAITQTTEGRTAKLLGAVVVLALALSAPVLWSRASRWSEGRVEKVPIREPAPLTTADVSAVPLTPVARAQFQGAVGRLSRVLAGKAGRAPQELLREVHDRYKSTDPSLCAFDWRNGQPSLLYTGGRLSLGQTIQRCADAIEQTP